VNRKKYFCSAILLTLAFAFTLISVRMATSMLEKKLRQINGEIIKEEERCALARTELAYLSRPERIRALAERFLNLRQASYNQISFEFAGVMQNSSRVVLSPKPQATGWRYKHTSRKYVKAN
jgi:cell division protein FtsL